MKIKRTYKTQMISKKDVGQTVALSGWADTVRDHGGVLFIDLRDRFGQVQLVFNPEENKHVCDAAQKIHSEYVISVSGVVRERPEGTENNKISTGEVEILVDELEILNTCEPLPFPVNENLEISEEIRLKYRYLDIRRPDMMRNMRTRYKITQAVRNYLDSQDFIEIETPVLNKSTPEGARDFVVPSRINDGKFYALPQSPQLFKQILMVAGTERYYQLARCFRDEDLRADRQLEHTQIDMELSFVDSEDVFNLIEGMVQDVFAKVMESDEKLKFPRMTYADAMNDYGSDKPDTRFDIKIKDVTEIVKDCGFKVFSAVAGGGGMIRAINAKNCAGYSLKDIENLTNEIKIFGARGLAWFKVGEEGLKSQIAKFFTPEELAEIQTALDGKEGDLLLFVADKKKVVCDALGHLRQVIAQRENLIDESKFNFLWVTDFPLFEYSEEDKRFYAVHHPFTSPKEEDLERLESDPGSVNANAYDLVLNGVEMGGGSIRIHDKNLQEKMFKLLGIDDETAKVQFGFLLDAFKFGAPPHGGIAIGLDRFVMLLLKLKSIREVIAFPKTQKGICLMTESPSEITEQQLREVHIKLRKAKKQ